MIALQPSAGTMLLLHAALNPNADRAVACWQEWLSQNELETAPAPQLRLLTSVYAHLTALAPGVALPPKLRGKARATFAGNQVIAGSALGALTALETKVPVTIGKGLALCARFGIWSSRQMGDADLYVAHDRLEEACAILAEEGWVPKYGMTWTSLVHRSAFRRNSWNITKGHGEIDLHWRLEPRRDVAPLTDEMLATAETVDLLGRRCRIANPEFATYISLAHGVGKNEGDALQTIIDCARLLPVCDPAKLSDLIARAGCGRHYTTATETLTTLGLGDVLPAISPAAAPARVRTAPPAAQIQQETALLSHPRLYRLWSALGSRSQLERLMIRWSGPVSRPLVPTPAYREDYDLRDCGVIDALSGPGWGWPEPEHTCFWSDGPDVRLLVPLSGQQDHQIILSLSPHRTHSSNKTVAAFANGHLVTTLDLSERGGEYGLLVPRHILSGPWVELSFRPLDYAGKPSGRYPLWRTLPVSRLRVFTFDRLTREFAARAPDPLSLRILKGEEPYLSRFNRIRTTIEASPFRTDPGLPVGFDPYRYVLGHDDLFVAEVDPYQHYLAIGRIEGRALR